MASWTPEYSTILSFLLDGLLEIGTQKIIDIRRDFCRLHDCIGYARFGTKRYYTGSNSEGLRLKGSDVDVMVEINNDYNIQVIQSLDENTDASPYSTFLMSTEDVPPGFALLQHVQQTPFHPFLYQSSQNMNGLRYLGSDLFIQNSLSEYRRITSTLTFNKFLCTTSRRQGPSKEISSPKIPDYEPADDVDCIHCAFWPSEALEWRHRPRHFDWPTSEDILSIVDFGFHLVAIGHPNSDTKLLEWRVSFSVAERTLAWSFNHIQMQCYALMKIILKDFIKVRCNPQNQVLCSYFIKTFLFWRYEETELSFWSKNNFRQCIKYLLVEFSKRIREGVLRHYFIPRFNLLSVKLTRAAQNELLQLFDIIIESDINILNYCRTFGEVGFLSEFYNAIARGTEHIESIACSNEQSREIWIFNDMCLKETFETLNDVIYPVLIWSPLFFCKIFCQILTLDCKTPLQMLALKKYLLDVHISSSAYTQGSGNKCAYQLRQIAQNEFCSFDISTCKLWCAILLYMKGDCSSTLDMINQVMSSIPPYAAHRHIRPAAEQLYKGMFMNSNLTTIQKVRKAWMFHLKFMKDAIGFIPLGIQIELYFSHVAIELSPFTCAYYLQFLCYQDLHRYDSRDRALELLVDFVAKAIENDHNSILKPFADINIAGHCLLLAGKIAEAHDMFYMSRTLSKRLSYEQNSAHWYLTNCF